MPSVTHHEKPYWTKFYIRQSYWIGKYGCYKETYLTKKDTFCMHLPSAGLCQEFCMEDDKSDRIFFGVQGENCTCLSEKPATLSLPLNQCKFDCLKNNSQNYSLECGGSVVYSVFVSGRPDFKCKDSNANCHQKEVNIIENETKCNSVDENYRDKCEITTQMYTGFDRGKELSASDKRDILLCQQCTEKGCLFTNCKSHLNITNFTKNVLSSDHPSDLKTTKPVMVNVTEKGVSFKSITHNNSDSRYKKNTPSQRDKESRTTQSTRKEDTTEDKSMTLIIGCLASSTVIGFLSLIVAIYIKRRKRAFKEAKNSTLQKQLKCSTMRSEEASIANLNPQNKQGHQDVTGASCYELADNSKLTEKYSKNKNRKEPYYDTKEAFPRNDVYSVATFKAYDRGTVNFDRKEDSSDQLKGIKCSKQEENTYDHVQNVNESNYSCLNVARNLNSQIVNDLYDHI